jgi:hypothetical protein
MITRTTAAGFEWRHGGDSDEDEEFTPYSGMYFTSDGHYVYCMQGEEPAFTACSSECGYCGRCIY